MMVGTTNFIRFSSLHVELLPDERRLVAGTVEAYSNQNDMISWIAYLVLEVLKSLFGQSDWQRAKKILTEKIRIHEYDGLRGSVEKTKELVAEFWLKLNVLQKNSGKLKVGAVSLSVTY